MKKVKIIVAIVIPALILIGVGAFYFLYSSVAPKDGQICEGVYVDSVSLAGMTKEEAQTKIDAYVEELAGRGLDINVAGNQVSASLKDLGVVYDKNDFATQAYQVGREGNLFNKYDERKKVKSEKKVFVLKYTLDEEKLSDFVEKQCGKFTKKAKNAKVKRKNQQFVYVAEKKGTKVDVATTIEKVKAAILNDNGQTTIQVDAAVTEDIPKVDKETASLCKDKIGTFSTTYNTYAVSRSKNLANAASLIDGTVVYPGETFSVYNAISPIEESNGYYPAPSYNNGEVVDTAGGGVCQVSTTLYNAVLKAELEIVDRFPHSMIVSYVEPSMDAAIAGTYKDLKFKNTTDAPIYIMGGASGGTIYFTVYGHETRDSSREVRYESETIEKMKPGADKVTKDPTQPDTYKKVTQEAHFGYKAKLWKVVTENGKETRTQVNASTYAAVPRYITVGTKKTKKKKETEKEDLSDKDTKATPSPKPSTDKSTEDEEE